MVVATLVGVPSPQRIARKEQTRHAAIHVVRPLTRLDYFSLVAFAVVVFAAVEREWIMVGVALFAVLVAVVLPQMAGPFELKGPITLKGELLNPEVPRLRGLAGDEATLPPRTAAPGLAPPAAPPDTTSTSWGLTGTTAPSGCSICSNCCRCVAVFSAACHSDIDA